MENNILRRFKAFIDINMKIIKIVTIIMIIVMFFIVFSQVISRYIMQYSWMWPEEIVGILFSWVVLLGGCLALYERRHPSINFLIKKCSEKQKKVIIVIREIIVAIVFSQLFYYAIQASKFAIVRHTAASRISWFYLYVSLPIATFYLVLITVYNILKVLKIRW